VQPEKEVKLFRAFRDVFGRTNTWGGVEGIKRCVGAGWGPLVERLVDDLFLLGWDGELHQVKEKFGGLRFYIGNGSDEIFERIDQAEDESFTICEECGKPGKVWPDWGWVITHCEECNRKRRLERAATAEAAAAERRGGVGEETVGTEGTGGGTTVGGSDFALPPPEEVEEP
jgi:hypothetical protein